MAAKETTDHAELLTQRQECSTLLELEPHNPVRHLRRGQLHLELGFPDLAAADAYHALTLFDSVEDPESSEYQARKLIVPGDDNVSTVTTSLAELTASDDDCSHGDETESETEKENILFEPVSYAEYEENIGDVYLLLVNSLAQCGCLRDAYDFCMQAIRLLGGANIALPALTSLKCLLGKLKQVDHADGSESDFNPAGLETRGYARRVIYPWNTHEPDRNSPDIVHLLNNRLQHVAPNCEVRAVELPSLHNNDVESKVDADGKIEGTGTSIQLGLFAKEDIAPGEVLLHESSMLTATNRLHDDICDACNGKLPELSSSDPSVACEDCEDTVFCSEKCHDMAQELYHAAVCGCEGLESIGKDIPNPKDKADYLYLLLLERAIAMAATQSVHPLELPEVKYIWGDFHSLDEQLYHNTPPNGSSKSVSFFNHRLNSYAALPFSFQLNIVQPMRILEEMGMDPFTNLDTYDTWVFNSLYAKFRGTASGRLSTWDGGPEVCAVHPLWCLANHSCDPNVRWEWGGEISFMARKADERVKWGPENQALSPKYAGIKKGEEILNHYCDVNLSVKDRREWAMGALGGSCLCERCIWEAAQQV
ncbi:hypothetical protein FQN57_000472 [Myotisia sp. PD_48]|nr:hypothetical protein FQN57_000472 [Myotisia sp. PD_48]